MLGSEPKAGRSIRPPATILFRKDCFFQKAFIRVLCVVCILSVFSVSVFASGTSSTPVYPSSTYTYVRGLSSTGSIYTGSATYFDAVTDSLVGIGDILGSMWIKLDSIRTNTGYLSSIATDTDNLFTIKSYVYSGNTWLSKIYSDVASIKTSLSSGFSAWTSNQASTVTSNSTLIETNTRNISNKVATEATLKTLARQSTVSSIQSTVSSIKNILVSFETNLDTITSKVSDLAAVLASPEDKKLHDVSKPNFDYVNGDFSTNISDTDKFDTVSDSITGFGNIFGSSDLSISGIISKAQQNGYGFWSQQVNVEINSAVQSPTRSRSVSSNGSCSLPYDPYENYNRMISRFSFGGD